MRSYDDFHPKPENVGLFVEGVWSNTGRTGGLVAKEYGCEECVVTLRQHTNRCLSKH